MITGSNDEALWKELWDLTVATYGELTSKRPSKKNPGTAELVAKLKEFASESSFMCEFPSIFGTPCNCDDANINRTLPPWGKHGVFEAADSFAGSLTLDETLVYLQCAINTIMEAYTILKRPAKEVIVNVASDLNCMVSNDDSQVHAVPIPYALSGFSLRMNSERHLIDDASNACLRHGLQVKSVDFDG